MEVATFLRQRLLRGDWPQLLPSEMQLAQELQVGRNTVRAALAVLEDEGLLRSAVGRRREVIADPKTRQRRPGKALVLLLPAPWQSLPPASLLWMDALRTRLQTDGWQVTFAVEPKAFRRTPAAPLEALVARHPSTVWLLYRSTAPMQRWFQKQQLRTVIAGSCHTGVTLPQVDTDYRATSRHAASRLLGLGHLHLAVLTPAAPFAGDDESLRGFREGAAGATVQLITVKDTKASVIHALRNLLAAPHRPTAIYSLEARQTATTLSYLAQQGIAVPSQMALLSRDHDPLLEHLVPEPARYERQPDAFAKKLAHLVTALGAGLPLKPSQHLIMPTFVRGETLGPPPVLKKNR